MPLLILAGAKIRRLLLAEEGAGDEGAAEPISKRTENTATVKSGFSTENLNILDLITYF